MKEKFKILKWMAAQTKPYMRNLVLLTMMGGIVSLVKVYMAYISKDLIDSALLKDIKSLVSTGSIFCMIALIQVIFNWLTADVTVRTQENMSGNLRVKVYSHLSSANWNEYTKYHSGDIQMRVMGDTKEAVDGIIEGITQTVTQLISLFGAFFVLYQFSREIALITILIGPFSLLFISLLGSRYIVIHENTQEAEGRYRAYLQECLSHMLIVKIFGRENESVERLRKLQADKKKYAIRRTFSSTLINTITMAGIGVVFLLIFAVGMTSLFSKNLTIGTFTAYIQLIIQILNPFLEFTFIGTGLLSAAGSSKRLMELEMVSTEKAQTKTCVKDFDEIILDNLNFSYKADAPVLKGASAVIRSGEIIGLIGASGQGKTTLINLIMQLLEPDKGCILIKKENTIYHMEQFSMRDLISYVPQGNTLFSGTIDENLSMGRKDAGEEEKIAALKDAGAWEFVKELEEGIHTVVGEYGIGLSEGQAQRIAIARALLRKTPLLILDEATSALDMNTERVVLSNIKEKRKGHTSIIITHRLSVLPYCDRVFSMEKGILKEREPVEMMAEPIYPVTEALAR